MRIKELISGIAFGCAFVLFASSFCCASTLVVDLKGGKDFTEIQPAIDAAADGDMVLVKPGEYVITEPINFNRLHEPGDPASPAVKNITVKSEAGPEVTTIRMGEPKDPKRASVVIFENWEGKESVLEGFTLTGGKGTSIAEGRQIGGGIACHGSSPYIADCRIIGNNASGRGGGVYCASGSFPVLVNCIVSKNHVARQGSGTGGGVYCIDSTLLITDSTISENSGDYNGGITGYNSSLTLLNCKISMNSSNWGGGVLCYKSSATITDCAITDNKAETRAGGLYIIDSSVTLINCSIAGNSVLSANCSGGGMSCHGSSAATMINCSFLGNKAAQEGGGVFGGYHSSLILINCTLSENSAEKGGAIYGESWLGSSSFSAALRNCIVWKNGTKAIDFMEGVDIVSTHSCIEGDDIWEGEGNINSDPVFIQVDSRWDNHGTPNNHWDDTWSGGDYHLRSGSPTIDAGTCEGAPGFDIEANARPAGAGCDMGAYEFRSLPAQEYIRGEANSDGRVDIADMVFILQYQFSAGTAPSCLKTADLNDDGLIDLADPIFGLNYLFASGPEPPSPLAVCSMDPTADILTCESYPPCK